ncbi:3-hydroxyacyl-CoA dehydrogenase family protein [Paraconexibacter antarcticus]|uniref:3-hydroxyacyl-CoA dehydrogenase family protein n=1 Tax=Paraconexibacter antarcticus TaxID=2949664 RepID=A0ABY5DWZ6_9ACTN|nr:3-hydroxyacyl-CoA dehydrogenase family protein [Paraconexibacter antarcticus]UTI66546.1 3-hydroxyacyl-CoA dehydrogenase family protein [Paraconexibacter antarcticus]
MQESIAIAGSGAIATGFAAAAAGHGEVVLWARSDASAARARAAVDKLTSRMEGVDGAAVRIVTDLEELQGATVIVEAISEDLEAKAPLLKQLAALGGPNTMLCTTTSSLSVHVLASAAGVPERFVGLHVFNPVTRMELVELAYADETVETIRARARDLCVVLGKKAVEVPDIAGFVVNRLLFPYLFSAVDLMETSGLTPEAIDTCMKLGAGHPMGPLALLDYVGLDVSSAIGEAIGVHVPHRIHDLVAIGSLGKKSGKGFYTYD